MMIDPLGGFDWKTLYGSYDAKCNHSGRFKGTVPALNTFSPKPNSDRSLYYEILSRIRQERESGTWMSLTTYEAIVYWKMYSTCGDNINRDIHNKHHIIPELMSKLPHFSGFAPRIIQHKNDVLSLVTETLGLRLYGMGLPVCTAVLHFLYPDVIPIFDKMVLMAVGYTRDQIKREALNQNQYLYGQYVEHVWSLTKRYANQINAQKFEESPTRIVDMALWVTR
jgi:hypothetical protein